MNSVDLNEVKRVKQKAELAKILFVKSCYLERLHEEKIKIITSESIIEGALDEYIKTYDNFDLKDLLELCEQYKLDEIRDEYID